jgi:hypothetical protein
MIEKVAEKKRGRRKILSSHSKNKYFTQPQPKPVLVLMSSFLKGYFFFFFNEDGLGFSSHQYITKTRSCIINYQFLFVDDHSFFLRRFV